MSRGTRLADWISFPQATGRLSVLQEGNSAIWRSLPHFQGTGLPGYFWNATDMTHTPELQQRYSLLYQSQTMVRLSLFISRRV